VRVLQEALVDVVLDLPVDDVPGDRGVEARRLREIRERERATLLGLVRGRGGAAAASVAGGRAARGESDDTKRAQDVIAAQKIITDQLVWFPMVAPNNVVIMNKKVTGAPATFVYMFGPWAAYLGGA